MILRKVTVSRFRSIRNSCEVAVDGRVTVLLGANDHGKSNLLLAISHLNYDNPFAVDDLNWDVPESESKKSPSIKAIFELNDLEQEDIHREVIFYTEEYNKNNPEHIEFLFESLLSPQLEVERNGIPGVLSYNGTPYADLPPNVQNLIKTHQPRFELFTQFSGDVQDQADATSITASTSEFIQGIFFQAGLDEKEWVSIFTQNDLTMRRLDDASEILNTNLSGMWGQGASLRFMLRHHGSTIQFCIKDPTAGGRYVRLSKKSTGVTHFFRLSMTLHARRKKHPANSYVYLFDEPGVYLHPLGQRDLLQAFELLTDTSQIVLSTHSLFLLNTNFPERHRLVYMDADGTAIDHKPYRASWRLATDALGVRLGSMALFSNSTLLVEGESDPLYFYELLRILNLSGVSHADANQLGLMSYTDLPTLKYLIQMLTADPQKTQLAVLLDGDKAGKEIGERIRSLCTTKNVPIINLPEGFSIENLCLFRNTFCEAVVETIEMACQAENTPIPPDLRKKLEDSLSEYDKGLLGDDIKRKTTLGYWFKNFSKSIVESEASKTALARLYVDKCREEITFPIKDEQLQVVDTIIKSQGQRLIEQVVTALKLPNLKANKSFLNESSN